MCDTKSSLMFIYKAIDVLTKPLGYFILPVSLITECFKTLDKYLKFPYLHKHIFPKLRLAVFLFIVPMPLS